MTTPESRASDAYTREERRDREFAFRTEAFILATGTASLAIYGVAWVVLSEVPRWTDVAVLAIAAALSNLPRRASFSGRGLSLSGAIMLAAIPLGAGLGIPLIAAAGAIARFRAQRAQQIVFNAAAATVSGVLAALSYVLLGAPVMPHRGLADAGRDPLMQMGFGLVIAIVVQALTAATLLAGVLWASRGISVRSSFLDLISDTGLVYLAMVGLAFLIVVTWVPAGAGPASVLLLSPTFVASRFAVGQSGNEWTARVRAIRAFTTAMDERDPGAAVHAADVARVSEWIADELTMNPLDSHALNLAGALHGIDRLGVPGPGPERSATAALEEMNFLAPALPILRRFREPAGSADPPPRTARVLAVADSYARARALGAPGTTVEVRRAAFTELAADRSGRFDPGVVAALGRVLDRVDPIFHHGPAPGDAALTERGSR